MGFNGSGNMWEIMMDSTMDPLQNMVQHAFSELERDWGKLVSHSLAFYTACKSFDQKKNGSYRLDDFISLCIFLQSARYVSNLSVRLMFECSGCT
ncbi:hypothetical protein Ddye_028478 [Dipteronia dyeriana]|uniref:Uncharacterized protein n=1 Tax=Dipteronia dyeriana TaxID=168575 RepID=A0AAD9WSD1_9ROSI|nr:hypothetical protein Ddye_028478 [Dipteronia dyeriana]